MKKIIRLTESDLAIIVKRVIKEETDQKTDQLMQNLDVVMGTEDDLGDKVEKANVCDTCIKGIEGVETIPACKRLCERGRKKKQVVRDCVWGFSKSKYGGSPSDFNSPRYQLLYCLVKGFNLNMGRTKTPKTTSNDDINSEMI
jgi:hypothetical protein